MRSLTDKSFKRTFEGHRGYVKTITMTPSCSNLITDSSDFSVKIWDTLTAKCTTSVDFNGYIRGTHLLPGNKKIIVALHHGRIWKVDFFGSKTLECATTYDITTTCVVQHTLVVGTANGNIHFIGLNDYVTMKTFYVGTRVWHVCASPCNTYIATQLASPPRGQKLVLIPTQAEEVKKFGGHDDFIMTSCFTHDGTHVLTGSMDKSIKVWPVQHEQSFKLSI